LPQALRPFHLATEDDITYCYRFFLQRKPDPEGLAYWSDQVKTWRITVQELTNRFMYSEEALRLREHNHRAQLVELSDFRMYLRPYDFAVGAVILSQGTWEPHVSREMRPLLQPGAVFVDVGANIGYFTLLAATLVGDRGRVIAFEPNANNRALLEQSIQANGFANIQLHANAVDEKARTLRLFATEVSSLSLVLAECSIHAVPEMTRPSPIEAVALDEFLADIDRLDVVKIDTDGAEPRVLAGMRRLIAKHRPVIFAEFFPEGYRLISNRTAESFLDELIDLGYDLHVIPVPLEQPTVRLSNTQILQRLKDTGLPALDLVAYPQTKRRDSSNRRPMNRGVNSEHFVESVTASSPGDTRA
jgi:FkbM family methyltransferase